MGNLYDKNGLILLDVDNNIIDLGLTHTSLYSGAEIDAFIDSVGVFPRVYITNVTRNKISAVAGMDVSTVTFKSDQDLVEWEARADGNGHGSGNLVGGGTTLSANTSETFDVENEELSLGDKTYRINVYGKNINGEWSVYE